MDKLDKLKNNQKQKKETLGLAVPWQEAMLCKWVWWEPVVSSHAWQQLNPPVLQWSLGHWMFPELGR
jgi:hypothetical protein